MSDDADVPRCIGPYQVQAELGRGAMAIVYRAYDPELEREVAIKEPQIAPGMRTEDREALLARFEVEAKAAARLSHPGVVAVYQTVRQEGNLYIVMELLAGSTLAERRAAAPMAPDEAARITWELASALAYAHSKGIVHRDVKPDNVFILDDGHVKLGDFGVARLGMTSQFTHAGTVLGTPGYMSPEQVLGRTADQRSDVFSLGVLFHTLLTGVNPYGADSGTEFSSVMYRIVHEDVPPIGAGTQRPDVHPAYEAIVRKATARDPAHRYGSASEMAADIATKHGPEIPPPSAYPPPPAEAAGTVMAGSGPPPAVEVAPEAPSTQPVAPSAPKTGGGHRTALIAGGLVAAALAGLVVVGVSVAVFIWRPWETMTTTGGPGGLPGGLITTSTPVTGTPPGGDQQALLRRQYLSAADAVRAGLDGVQSDLRANSERINTALADNSPSEVRAARTRLSVVTAKTEKLRSRLPVDPTGRYSGIDQKMSRMLELADTRVESQRAICDAYLSGARGEDLTQAGQPWGHQARVEFERLQAQLAQQLAAAQAASP